MAHVLATAGPEGLVYTIQPKEQMGVEDNHSRAAQELSIGTRKPTWTCTAGWSPKGRERHHGPNGFRYHKLLANRIDLADQLAKGDAAGVDAAGGIEQVQTVEAELKGRGVTCRSLQQHLLVGLRTRQPLVAGANKTPVVQ